LISLPNRKDFIDYPDVLLQIDQFKKEYLTIIHSTRSLFSENFCHEYLRDEMNMLTEHLIDNLGPMEMTSYFVPLEKVPGYDEVTLITKMGKLKLYFERVIDLEYQVTLRLVALQEIAKEKVFLLPNKKRALQEEINNLSSSLIVFINQKTAITKEFQTSFREYDRKNSMSSSTLKNTSEAKDNQFRRLRHLLHILHHPFYQEVRQLNHHASISYIILMEQVLEEYVYHHKIEASKLKEQLDNLKDDLREKESVPLSKRDWYYTKNFGILKQKVAELECLYEVFCDYGHHVITKEELEEFYQFKFRVETCNILKSSRINLGDTLFEKECYKNIVSNKISSILKGNNIPDFFHPYLKLVSKIIKGKEKSYNLDSILKNQEILAFILAFDEENIMEGLKNYYDNHKVSDDKLDELCQKFIRCAPWISRTTLYTMHYLNGNTNKDPNYLIFKLLMEKGYINYNILDDLKEIQISLEDVELSSKEAKFLQRFKEFVYSKVIDIPRNIVLISGPLYRKKDFEYVRLNYPLGLLGPVFQDSYIYKMRIPSSILVKTLSASGITDGISEETFLNAKIGTIYLEEEGNVNLIRDKDGFYQLYNFVETLFYAIKSDANHWYSKEKILAKNSYYDEEKHEDYKQYWHKRYYKPRWLTYYESFYEIKDEEVIYEIFPRFAHLVIFFSNDESSVAAIEFDEKELSFMAKRNKKNPQELTDDYLNEKEVYFITQEFIKMIKNKSKDKEKEKEKNLKL